MLKAVGGFLVGIATIAGTIFGALGYMKLEPCDAIQRYWPVAISYCSEGGPVAVIDSAKKALQEELELAATRRKQLETLIQANLEKQSHLREGEERLARLRREFDESVQGNVERMDNLKAALVLARSDTDRWRRTAATLEEERSKLEAGVVAAKQQVRGLFQQLEAETVARKLAETRMEAVSTELRNERSANAGIVERATTAEQQAREDRRLKLVADARADAVSIELRDAKTVNNALAIEVEKARQETRQAQARASATTAPSTAPRQEASAPQTPERQLALPPAPLERPRDRVALQGSNSVDAQQQPPKRDPNLTMDIAAILGVGPDRSSNPLYRKIDLDAPLPKLPKTRKGR